MSTSLRIALFSPCGAFLELKFLAQKWSRLGHISLKLHQEETGGSVMLVQTCCYTAMRPLCVCVCEVGAAVWPEQRAGFYGEQPRLEAHPPLWTLGPELCDSGWALDSHFSNL